MVNIFKDKNKRFIVRYEDRPHTLVYKVVQIQKENFVRLVKVNISIMQALFWWTDSSPTLNHSKSYSIYKCVCEREYYERIKKKHEMV